MTMMTTNDKWELIGASHGKQYLIKQIVIDYDVKSSDIQTKLACMCVPISSLVTSHCFFLLLLDCCCFYHFFAARWLWPILSLLHSGHRWLIVAALLHCCYFLLPVDCYFFVTVPLFSCCQSTVATFAFYVTIAFLIIIATCHCSCCLFDHHWMIVAVFFAASWLLPIFVATSWLWPLLSLPVECCCFCQCCCFSFCSRGLLLKKLAFKVLSLLT